MDLTIINLSTFAAAAMSVVAAISILSDLILREKSRIRERLQEEFGSGGQARARKASLFNELKAFQSETSRSLPAVWHRFQVMVQQSAIEIEPQRIAQIALATGCVSGVAALVATRSWLLAAVAVLIGLSVPILYVHARRNARIHTLRMQLPDAFELMSRAVKAGQTMSGAMSIVAGQSPAPLSVEFADCCEQQNLGLPQNVALQELARRTGVIELQLFVVAMLIHRSAGGNPVDILENLSDVIRKRIRLLGKVKAATSEGRLQAMVLSVLPLMAFAALLFLNPTYAQVLLDRPLLLGAVLVSEILGSLWIRRIVTFEF